MRGKGLVALAALSLVAALSLTACQKKADTGADQPMFTDDQGLLSVPASSPLRSHLVVQAVGGEGAVNALELPAAVEADPARVANVLSPLSGRVTALKVALGARVRRGEMLATLASGDLAQAYADEDKARDAADLAQKALERAKGVQAAGGAANKDLEAAESASVQAQAELARAHTRLTSLNGAGAVRGRALVLTAPQDGVVTALAIAPGVQVSDPTAILMTVTNIDRVFVTANVAEDEVGKIGVGTDARVSLTAYPGWTLHGRVSEANAALEPDTRRRKVRIALDNTDGRLMPNMYATVSVAGSATGAVYVPQSALLMNNDATSVLVEVRPWVFQRRPVQIGDETETAARVVSGLGAGERVVVKGGVLLND
ncbi:MAG TPA: efflux RND transporter periplasmic adaptor subunit [Caulobacteraceae bacterium]|jgi:cobalt-zinc-cadmium efflux system membrane fusion protein|nr:efflux RND transporter periplasmic adaptor subunit [Caulobacteraceae bacterium]